MDLICCIRRKANHQAGTEQNIKVLLKLFQKLAGGAGGQRPPAANRNAKRSTRNGEQTVEANHPVDDLPERLCGRRSCA